MTKNWADRIKLIIFTVVLIPFISLVFFLVFAFAGFFKIVSMNHGIIISTMIAICIVYYYISKKFIKLRQEESTGKIPDISDRNNISLPQAIMSFAVITLLVAAYINYKLYSITAAKLLLGICITAAAIEIIYIKHRKN